MKRIFWYRRCPQRTDQYLGVLVSVKSRRCHTVSVLGKNRTIRGAFWDDKKKLWWRHLSPGVGIIVWNAPHPILTTQEAYSRLKHWMQVTGSRVKDKPFCLLPMTGYTRFEYLKPLLVFRVYHTGHISVEEPIPFFA
jgi:hypothetical protein